MKSQPANTLYDAVIHIPHKRDTPMSTADMKMQFNRAIADFRVWLRSLPDFGKTLDITGDAWISSSIFVRTTSEVLQKIVTKDVVVYVDLSHSAPMNEIQDK
jgi:hypothetical protein